MAGWLAAQAGVRDHFTAEGRTAPWPAEFLAPSLEPWLAQLEELLAEGPPQDLAVVAQGFENLMEAGGSEFAD